MARSASSLSNPEQIALIASKLTSKGFISIPEAAKIVGLHPVTLRKYISTGKLNTIRVGARKMLTLQELHRFLDHGDLVNPYEGVVSDTDIDEEE